MITDQSRQQALLVFGMHRSGTSAAARVLNLLGAELNVEMLGASFDNPKGFWESAEAVAIHERFFAALSRTCYDMQQLPEDWTSFPAARQALAEIVSLVSRDFDGKALWAVKDPRICLLAPLWLEALESLGIQAKALFIVRNPVEVSESLHARSLRARNPWQLGYGPVMWAQYLASAEVATRSIRRAMMTYDELLTDWRNVMDRVARDLDITWPRAYGEAGAEIDAFLDQSERHYKGGFDLAEALRLKLPTLVVRMYEACLRILPANEHWQGLTSLAEEFLAAVDLYSGAIDNVLRHYHDAEARVVDGENSKRYLHAVLELKEKELGEYQCQVKTYDDLLRKANARNETLNVMYEALVKSAAVQKGAFERDLMAYQEQAQTYDRLLREANGRVEDLARQLQEQAEANERDLAAYREQAQTYDRLLREANGRIENLTRQLQEQAEANERDLAAYREQGQTYDRLLREANGRIENLTRQLQEQAEADERDLAAYREHGQTYDRLLREANGRIEDLTRQLQEQAEADKRDLAAYREQAQTYDQLLRGADHRIESMAMQLQEQAAAFERDLAAYREQAQTYDDLLREADSRVKNITMQFQEQAAAFERELAAYREQAQTYDDLLREANGRIESLTKQIQGTS